MISHAFASFLANLQLWFRSAQVRKLSQFMVSQAFASFRKDSQMDFRKDSSVQKSWFFARIRNGHFADEQVI